MSATVSSSTVSETPRHAAKTRAIPGMRWLVSAMILFVMILALPTLIAWSPLKQRILPMALPGYTGNLELGSASLGWFSNVRLQNVQIDGLDNQPLLTVSEIKLERTLLNLLMDRENIGKVTLVQPHAMVRVRPGGSNLEDAIAEITANASASDAAVSIVVQNGKAEIVSAAGTWQIDSLSGNVVPPHDAVDISAQFTGNVSKVLGGNAATPPTVGNFQFQLSPAETAVGTEKALKLQLLATTLPLDICAAAFERANVAAQTGGTLNARLAATFTPSGNALVNVESVQANGLLINAPAYLADTLQLQQVQSSGQLQVDADQIRISAAQLQCDFANAQISGDLPRDWRRLTSVNDLRNWLQAHSVTANAAVNLAGLTAALPRTLALRQDTTIQSGVLKASLQTAVANSDDPAKNHRAAASLTDVVAIRDGKTITAAPIQFETQITDTGSQLLLSKLTGDATFMQLRGQGSAQSGKIELETQLGQLRTQLAQFVDLGEAQLAGGMTAALEWTTQEQQFQLSGRGQATGLAIYFGQGLSLKEPQVNLAASATGSWTVDRTLSLSQGQFDMTTQSDDFRVGLAAPVADVSQFAADLQFAASGSAANWLGRLQTLAGNAEPFQVTGTLEASGLARVSADQLSVTNSNIDFQDFQLISEHLVIREPVVKIQATAQIARASGAVVIPSATYSSSAIAGRIENLEIQLQPLVARGVCQLRGDTSKIVQMLPALAAPQTRFTGETTAFVELSPAEEKTNFRIEAHLAPLVIEQWQTLTPGTPAVIPASTQLGGTSPGSSPGTTPGKWQPLVSEQDVAVTANGTVAGLPLNITLADSKLSSTLAMATASGTIISDNAKFSTNLQGKLAYDLNRLSSFAKPYLPLSATAVGQGEQPWKLVAVTPLGTPEDRIVTQQTTVDAQAAVAWTAASVEGVAVGPGQLNIRGQNQRISLSAGEIPLGQGTVNLASVIDWETQQGARATIPAGVMIRQVNLTKEACRGWLKYAAPLTAEATEITGTFSVDWKEPLVVPLSNPQAARGQGVMTIHAAKLAPSPFGQRLIFIARQIEAAVSKRATTTTNTNLELNLPAQQIQYQVQDGRVWHQGFRAQVGDVLIGTRGSVGFDQSLEMVAEIPVQDAWITNGKLPATFKGQVLQIPIRGTFNNPKIDEKVLETLLIQGATSAAQGLLNQQLERGLNRLFGPLTQPQGQQGTQPGPQPAPTP